MQRTSRGRSGQDMQDIKSKPRNNASFGVSSSAVSQLESSSTGAATEPRHFSATQSTIHSHRWTGSRSIKTPANVCDVPRRHVFEQNGIISTRIEHRASARYSSVPHNTADTQTASPTVAPQTIGEGLVTFHRMAKPEEFEALLERSTVLIPLNTDGDIEAAVDDERRSQTQPH
jgi:hypothetical protein